MTRDEQAEGYVFGSLSPLERQEVARARLSDPELDAAIAELEQRFAPLAGLAGTMTPPEQLLDRVIAAIGKEADELAGMSILACEDGSWLPYAPGIELKPLWSPKTFMLRCRPGMARRVVIRLGEPGRPNR